MKVKTDHKNRKKSLAVSIQKVKRVLKRLRNVLETLTSIEDGTLSALSILENIVEGNKLYLRIFGRRR